MNSIGKVLTELINDLADLVVVFVGASFSDKSFKSSNGQKCNAKEDVKVILKSTLFPLIVKFVSQ